MDENRIVIKIFRRVSNFDAIKFHAVFSKNNLEYLEHRDSAISGMGYAMASVVTKCRKNDVSVTIKFPREIYEIDCPANIRAALFYEPISEAEIRVFWDRFGKAMLED